jgi:dephospho-CoA kinase
MIVAGVTGSIATGKSTVSNYLRSTYPLVDADKIARAILDPPSPAFTKVSTAFPEAIKEGTLDRDILSGIIFSSPGK